MKYSVDDLDFETVTNALTENKYGLDVVNDGREEPCYVTIYSDDAPDLGPIGYVVGSISRNPGMFATYTLVLDEHQNDRVRMATVLTRILSRKTMR